MEYKIRVDQLSIELLRDYALGQSAVDAQGAACSARTSSRGVALRFGSQDSPVAGEDEVATHQVARSTKPAHAKLDASRSLAARGPSGVFWGGLGGSGKAKILLQSPVVDGVATAPTETTVTGVTKHKSGLTSVRYPSR